MTDRFRRLSGPFFALALVALVIACLTWTRDYAVPIAIAIFLWMLISAFATSLQRTPWLGPVVPGWMARLIAILAIVGAIYLSANVIAQNVGQLGRGLSGEDAALLAVLKTWAAHYGIDSNLSAGEILERFEVQALIGWALRTAQGLIADASLVLLYVLFLLVDERFYGAKLRALFPDAAHRAEVESTLGKIGTEVRVYVWLMSVLSLGVALVTYLVCSATGLDAPGFWGFIAFALNFVPTIGSITAVLLPAVYGLVTLSDPVMLVILIGGLAATQFIAGELVLPRLMGDRLNLSTFVILLTLVVWGAMWGPAGMFLAIPITVILVMIFARFPTTRPVAILLTRDGRLPAS